MDANTFGAELGRDVAHCAFKRGFGNAHDVIVFNDHLAAVITHREQRSALAHQRFGQMRHANESPAGHIHRRGKAIPWYINHTAPKRVLWRKGNGMDNKVEFAPHVANSFEDLLHLPRRVDVEWHENRGFKSTRERLDKFLGFIVEVRDGNFSSECPKSFGASPGDGAFVGDTDNEALLAFEELGFHRGERD